MALLRVLLVTDAPGGEVKPCTARGLRHGEPGRSGAARRGAVGGREDAKRGWAGELNDESIREFTALRSSKALPDAPRVPAEGPA
eukprot:15468483-Alexandrium_andersonii.AAC.1